MSMRERFEVLHPVPDGVLFDEHLRVYYVTPGPHNPAKQLHCMCWSMWVESRAEMSVQLPDAHSYTVPDVAGAAILDCATAIQAAGAKVKL